MSDTSESGILYTEYSALRATTPIASLWSYDTCARDRARRRIARTPDGSHEFWLERSDPLLNTILPGTHVSVTVNLGDAWAAGRSLATSASVPRACVMGPFTEPRILRVGRGVHAVGAILRPTLTNSVFGVPASELVNQIVPLEDVWKRDEVERLVARLSRGANRHNVSALKDELLVRPRASSVETIGHAALPHITVHAGRVSIDGMARSHGLTRQQFARRFCDAAGLSPKLFARITRFQALVRTLLSTDVSQWASVASDVGYYDQAHMINEFRAFAGSPPTVFFQPHGDDVETADIQLRGRPSEWVVNAADAPRARTRQDAR